MEWRITVVALRQKLVACAVDGYEMYGLSGILFEFSTEPQNMIVDGAGAGIVFVAPDFIEQLIARDDQPWILSQILQSLELHFGQLVWLAFAGTRSFPES